MQSVVKKNLQYKPSRFLYKQTREIPWFSPQLTVNALIFKDFHDFSFFPMGSFI